VAIKKAINGQLLIICDDCESQWSTPEEAQSNENAPLEEKRALVPANAEDIKIAGWEKYLKSDAKSQV
jgi:hypothetical protein